MHLFTSTEFFGECYSKNLFLKHKTWIVLTYHQITLLCLYAYVIKNIIYQEILIRNYGFIIHRMYNLVLNFLKNIYICITLTFHLFVKIFNITHLLANKMLNKYELVQFNQDFMWAIQTPHAFENV